MTAPQATTRPTGWVVTTSLTAWCQTCGTTVEFAAPPAATLADLAAEERGCVWCGEALVLSFGLLLDEGSGGSVA